MLLVRYPQNGLIQEEWGERGEYEGIFGCPVGKWGITGRNVKKKRQGFPFGNRVVEGVQW